MNESNNISNNSNKDELINLYKNNLILQQDTEIFEVRILKYYLSGYFTADEEGIMALAKALEKRRIFFEQVAIYQTLQHVKNDLVPSERLNRLYSTKDDGYYPAKNDSIDRYRWVFIDVDPDHEANTQIPDSELHYAEEVRDKILDELKSNGFGEPMVVFSGNGQHIYLRIDQPNTDEVKKAIKAFVSILHHKYATGKLGLDQTVLNAGRITKFIGCWSTKGEDTPETPYRQCCLVQKGDGQINDFQLILDYIAKNKSDKPKSGSSKKKKFTPTSDGSEGKQPIKRFALYDVKAYLDAHKLKYTEKTEDNTHYYSFTMCPFIKEKKCGDCSIAQTPDHFAILNCEKEACKEIVNIFQLVKRYPCGKINLFDSIAPCPTIFNALVGNGRLLQSLSGDFFYNYKRDTYALDSEEFKKLIEKMYHSLIEDIPSPSTHTLIVNALSAYTDDEKYYDKAPVGRRMVLHDNTLYYALGKYRYVVVNANGCTITDTIPRNIYFVKTKMESQVEPDLSAKPEELPELLLQICNIDKEQISLLVANLLSFFRSDINSPILVLKGSKGACKSYCAKIIRAIVDPAKAELTSLPYKDDGLVVALSKHELCVFDNVERISETASSKLCMAVTNGYATSRKLFTDNTEFTVCIKSNIILTCITDVVSKSDLAERSNVINLERVAYRRSEASVNKQISNLLPKILGAVFNTLSVVFATADSIKLDNPPRMADFAQFAMAAIKAVGLDENKFLSLYTNHVVEAIGVCASDDPLISCIQALVDGSNDGVISMPSRELLCEIQSKASALKINLERRYTPSTLSRELNAKICDLQAIGIGLSTGRHGDKRLVRLKRQNPNIGESELTKVTEADILEDIQF